MGDPKKTRRKYSKPLHPWSKSRIEEEKKILEEYGLKNKKEIWRANSLLARFKKQAKNIIASGDEQSKKEGILLLDRLKKYNLVKEDKIGDVLDLTLKDILEKRLQTVVFKLGLCRTIKQARQLIVHKHISVNNVKVSVPSYLVTNQDKVWFSENSSFAKEDHPERPKKDEIKEKDVEIEAKKEKVEEKKSIKENRKVKSKKKEEASTKEISGAVEKNE